MMCGFDLSRENLLWKIARRISLDHLELISATTILVLDFPNDPDLECDYP